MKLKNLLCDIGIHNWVQDKELTCYDIYPVPLDKTYKTPTRTCERCGKHQSWLPGYGGSEIGCWWNKNSPNKETN